MGEPAGPIRGTPAGTDGYARSGPIVAPVTPRGSGARSWAPLTAAIDPDAATVGEDYQQGIATGLADGERAHL